MKYLLTLGLSLLYALSFAQTAPPSFTVTYSANKDMSSPVVTTTTTTSITLNGLTPGTPYYVQIKGSNGTVATTSTIASLSASTVGTAISSLTFTNAEANFPIVLTEGPPRYYQGTGSDWASSGNSGLATTKLPAGADGWISAQYLATDGQLAAIGFDSLSNLQSAGRPAIRDGFYFYNGFVGVIRDGVTTTLTQASAIGSYARIRRAIVGGVANVYLEYSADGANWSILTVPAFSFRSTGDWFVRIAININNKLYKPESSVNFVPK